MRGALGSHIHSHSPVEISQSGIKLRLGKAVVHSYQLVTNPYGLVITFEIEQNCRLGQQEHLAYGVSLQSLVCHGKSLRPLVGSTVVIDKLREEIRVQWIA